MKCKECDCCHLTTYTRWNDQKQCMHKVSVYECRGVKEPFEIPDINHECYEYPEKRAKEPRKVMESKENYLFLGNEECGIELTPTNLVFVQKGVRKTLDEMIRESQSDAVCPCCGRKLKEDENNA